MRILLIPIDPLLTDEHADLLRAFNENHRAELYLNVEHAVEFKPDLVFYQAGASVEDCMKIKEATGAVFVAWTGDCRYYPMQWLMDARELVDLYLLPFTGQVLERHKIILGKPCEFHWEYMQNWRYRDFKAMDSGRVIFIGNVNHSIPGGHDRQELINFLDDRVPEFEAWGSAENTNGMLPIKEMPDYYHDSYIVIAENNFHDVESYFTPRNMSGMAAGSCTLMREFPGIRDYFENIYDCLFYQHKYELLDAIQFLQANPDIRNKIALYIRTVLEKEFGMTAWVDQFIQITNGIIRRQ